MLTCLSDDVGQTQLNETSVAFKQTLVLGHKDVFTIADRSFRWEYPDDSPHLSKGKKSPKKSPSKVLGVNNSGNSIAKKGEGYAAVSPKAKAKAASPKKTPKGAKSPAKSKYFNKLS